MNIEHLKEVAKNEVNSMLYRYGSSKDRIAEFNKHHPVVVFFCDRAKYSLSETQVIVDTIKQMNLFKNILVLPSSEKLEAFSFETIEKWNDRVSNFLIEAFPISVEEDSTNVESPAET